MCITIYVVIVLDLFILLDDGSALSLGSQLEDIRQFSVRQVIPAQHAILEAHSTIDQHLCADRERRLIRSEKHDSIRDLTWPSEPSNGIRGTVAAPDDRRWIPTLRHSLDVLHPAEGSRLLATPPRTRTGAD